MNRNHLDSWTEGLALLALGGCVKEDSVLDAPAPALPSTDEAGTDAATDEPA